MATITLTGNANYSAPTVANGDTIDCAGFRLTVDAQPSQTNIIVNSPGTAGKMTISGAYDLSTWSVTAGTAILIDGAIPAGATLGTCTGGTAGSAYGATTNNGTILTANGGTAANAMGVFQNNGLVSLANASGASGAFGIGNNAGEVTVVNGGSVSGAFGISSNTGIVHTANGGSSSGANGVRINTGTVYTANGGPVGGADGIDTNNSSVTTANGGSAANSLGVRTNNGTVLRAFDGLGLAIGTNRGGPKLVIGPDYQTATTTYVVVSKIYSIGEVSPLAAIPGGIEIVILSEGSGGGGFSLSRVLN